MGGVRHAHGEHAGARGSGACRARLSGYEKEGSMKEYPA